MTTKGLPDYTFVRRHLLPRQLIDNVISQSIWRAVDAQFIARLFRDERAFRNERQVRHGKILKMQACDARPCNFKNGPASEIRFGFVKKPCVSFGSLENFKRLT